MTSISGERWARLRREERRGGPEERRSGWDRRASERRGVQLVVPVDLRAGAERRRVERRRGAAVLALPRSWGTGALKALLDEAARRVCVNWSNESGDAQSAAEVGELLEALRETLVSGGSPREGRLRSTLGRRLLELLRAEVVHLVAHGGQALPPVELWRMMEAIEALRAEIEPQWHDHFASRLAGPDGLELVMEVAHDLRSPLTSVLFLAEVLAQGQSGPVNDIQHRQLGLIYSAALGLTELTGNVIELARGGNRLTDGGPSPFSLTDLLGSVHDIVRPMAEEKGIEVRTEAPATDHRLGHAVALNRVLLNLTTNALKFTNEGFVEIIARETAGARIEFSVRDSGPGINQETADRLYSPFRRGPTGHRYVLSGTGLGLGLCRKLVRVMGSDLEVESRPHWGTRFYFELALPTVGPFNT
jgi:signal transduction histidine kinase